MLKLLKLYMHQIFKKYKYIQFCIFLFGINLLRGYHFLWKGVPNLQKVSELRSPIQQPNITAPPPQPIHLTNLLNRLKLYLNQLLLSSCNSLHFGYQKFCGPLFFLSKKLWPKYIWEPLVKKMPAPRHS